MKKVRNKLQRRLTYLKYYRKNREKIRDKYLKRKFGISVEDYDQMLEGQKGCCALCGKQKADKRNRRLHIDHDHKTNRIRGLLCFWCNHTLGLIRDNVLWLRNAANYLEKHQMQ